MRTLVQVRCERLHVTLLYRFLADLLHAHDSLSRSLGAAFNPPASPGSPAAGDPGANDGGAAAGASAGTAGRPAADGRNGGSSGDASNSRPPCLVEVHCTNLRVDLPRRSGSSEFLSLAVAAVTVAAPAAPADAEDLMPDMARYAAVLKCQHPSGTSIW